MNVSNFLTKKISAKLIALFLAVSVIPILIIGILSYQNAKTALEDRIFGRLETIGALKTSIILSYFQDRVTDAEMFSKLPRVEEGLIELNTLWQKAETKGFQGKEMLNYSPYMEAVGRISNLVEDYKTHMGFKDVLFISPRQGKILYSANQDEDFGTRLDQSATHLGKAWKKADSDLQIGMTDFAFYSPAGDNPEMFVIVPAYRQNTYVGCIAVSFSLGRINAIMEDTIGQGKSGESYLVGPDKLMRSDSRLMGSKGFLKQMVDTESVRLGLEGETGLHQIKDYRGVPVLSYFASMGLDKRFHTSFDWVVITEIDESEAFAPVRAMGNRILLIGIVISVLVTILAFFSARYISAPILKLTRVAKSMARGKLDDRFIISQKDELGDLGDSFRVMQESLQEKARLASEIAEGNLTVKIKLLSDEDVMGESFAMMVEKLRNQLSEINEGINVLAASSSEIMASVTQLAASSAETATSVGETTTTIEEVKQTAEVSSQKANTVSDNAVRMTEISSEGTKAIANTIEGMNKIRQQMNAIAGMVVRLSEQSQAIGEITSAVSELAEQSNLLAVNAAIEAAKAGEQGKGFTVVAQEIKMLADRSKEATGQVRNILKEVQKSIGSAVMATEEGGKAVDEGLKLTNLSGDAIRVLSESITEASKAAIQIAVSSQQQLEGMDQVVAAMENIKEASIQAAASTQQSVDSVNELQKVGQKLDALMKQYILIK